jgi:hypothetical protein
MLKVHMLGSHDKNLVQIAIMTDKEANLCWISKQDRGGRNLKPEASRVKE